MIKTWAIRLALSGLVITASWSELKRYAAERDLYQASGTLESVLNRELDANEVPQSLAATIALTRRAATTLTTDSRPPLIESTALLVLGDGPSACRILKQGIRHEERPELTINFGRALGISGDEAGAQAAFLRTAWISPVGVATLPSALRRSILARVDALEQLLRSGMLERPPPLPTVPSTLR